MSGADDSAVVIEGWLWKKKGSTAGSIFKSVTRRYCIVRAKGVFECYDDQDGELLTSVKISEAKQRGKWLYIRGFNDVKTKNCYLRFQGDFEIETESWAEKVVELVDSLFDQTVRNRGETLGMFFEDGEKRASAIAVERPNTIKEEEDEEEDSSESDGGEDVKEKTAVEDSKVDVKVEIEKTEGEQQEQKNVQEKESSDDAQVDEKTPQPSEEASANESTASVTNDTAKAAESSGESADASKDKKPAPSKDAKALWGTLASKTTGPESNEPAEEEAPVPDGKRLWKAAQKKAGPKPKKLYGADLLKHLALQSVTDMRVSKEAAEMERWRAKCELGDEMNPTKANILCFVCEERITEGYLALNGLQYHKSCFNCVVCNRSVIGGAYSINDALYCEEHRLKIFPECYRCKIDIKGKYLVGPKGTLYHSECFSCKGCDRKIRTYCEHEKEIYCVTCYSQSYASKCTACGQNLKDKIRTLQGTEEAAGMKWHESCFKCSSCKKRLHSKVFFQEQKLYCEYCMKKSNLPSCKKCKMPVEGACVNALDASWHPKCFVCTKCKDPLKGFIAKDEKPYCKKCYEEEFSKTCDICSKPIKGAFLNALGKTFHDYCFKCCNCEKKIDGSFMKSPDDLPCCSKDCLSEYYKNVILKKRAEANADAA